MTTTTAPSPSVRTRDLASLILSRRMPASRSLRNRSKIPVVLDYLASVPSEKRAQTRVIDLPAGPGYITGPLKAAGFDVTAAELFPEFHDDFLAQHAGKPLYETLEPCIKERVPDETRARLFPNDADPRWPDDLPAVQADMTKRLPFDDASFDIATCIEGIEHVTDRNKTLAEFRRILKPGGVLIVTTPNTLNLRARLAFALTGDRGFRSSVDEYTTVWGVSPDGEDVYHGHAFLISYPQLRYSLGVSGFRVRGVLRGPWSGTSIAMSPLMPLVYACTRGSQRKARKLLARMHDNGTLPDGAGGVHDDMLRHIMSPEVLYNRTLMVIAEAAERTVPKHGARRVVTRSSQVAFD